jgi:chromosome segregation protein
MRINRLELFGFKSFADRTVLSFGRGISCVVGPNGCGKSNIVDALKWCIGEQSAKSLRGTDMEDVIFAGAANRKPVGFAEVALTFSSEGGEPFPGEYARFQEVSICRRLHRSGQSEYLINNTKVRRKDILDLFLDTGVGNNLYSFIEQGRIDKVVLSTPEERRALIDEAAGISRYKQRREEAQQRLEQTATQLDRAADVADEMGNQLRVLERQVAKAARFRRLRALLKQDETYLGLVRFRDAARRRREAERRLDNMDDERDKLVDALERAEREVEARRGEAEVAEATVNRLRDEVAELDARRRETDGALGFEGRRVSELDAQLAAAREEFAAGESARDEAELDGLLAAEELAKAEQDLAEREAAFNEAKTTLDRAEVEAAEARQRASAADAQLAQRRASLDAELARRGDRERRRADLPVQQERVRTALEAVRDELVVGEKRSEIAQSAAEERRATLSSGAAEVDLAQREVDAATKAESDALTAVRAVDREIDEGQRALSSLSAEIERAAETVVRKGDEAARRSRQEGDAEIARWRQQADSQIARLRDQSRKEVAEADSAGRQQVQAAERARDEGTQRLRQELKAATDALEQQTLRRLAEEEKAANASAHEAERAALAEEESRVADARAQVDAARAGLAAAEARREDAARQSAALDGEIGKLSGRIAALEEQDRAASARGAGDVALRAALGSAPRLLDVLPVDDADRAWVGKVLGARLLAPVVRSADVLIAAAAKAKGGTAVYLPRDPTVSALLRDVAVVDDLAAALRSLDETGRPAVVRQTGERVDADGLVHLGAVADDADRALARGRDLATARTELEALRARREALRSAQKEAEGAIEAEKARRLGAEKELAARESSSREAARVAGQAARQAAAARIADERAAGAAKVRTERESAEIAVSARRGELDAVVDQARSHARAGTEHAREAGDARVEAERGRVEAEQAARRATLEERVASARADAEQRARDEQSAVATRRDQRLLEVERSRVRAAELRRQLDEARVRLESSRKIRQEAGGKVADVQLVLTRIEADLTAAHLQIDRARARERELEAESARLSAAAEALVDEVAAAETRIGELSALHDAGAGEAGIARERDLAAEVMRRAAAARRDELTASTAEARERRSVAASRREQATLRARLGVERAERAFSAIRSADAARGEAIAQVERAELELAEISEARGRAWDGLQAARTRLEAARVQAKEAEKALVVAREAREDAERSAGELELSLREATREAETVSSRLDERYQIDIAAMLNELEARSGIRLEAEAGLREGLEVAGKRQDPVEDLVLRPEMLDDEAMVREAVARMEENRTALSRVGEVNLAALEEYESVAGRWRELEAQRTDLAESVGTIRAAISKMNKTCRERFRDTFDRVNEHFQQAYPHLVGGGEARLELTDQEDLLETGVQIFVRPPGKRLQNLTLLSGGEKAMTAIALLLALFKVKPSPFCVLDEVDAPLDEANGGRYNDMLRQMSSLTQFICITHNRKTMECADTLYGITMRTPGCSNVVSVQIGDI